MSSCLIITQGNKMYIGADTACSVKTKDGYRRLSDDMPKLFSLGQSVFFCSGKKSDAEKCVNWIYDNFKTEIDINKLECYLKNTFTIINNDNVFNVEFLLCDYSNHKVIQLSQYNNFKHMIYDYSDELRILCGGYKTKDSFLMAKKNLILNKSTREIYKDVFESISDECVGGKVILYNSPTSFEIISLKESDIKYANNDNELFLLTSDFVTSGVVNGSQIIGGDIYSENYSSTKGTHLALNDGSFNFGHKIIYDAPTDKMTMKGVDIEWSSSTTPEISDIDGLSGNLSNLNIAVTNAQNTANGAKSVADNAKTLGDNLVNGLGFTKVSDSYVISPVIAGGTLLIGDKSGTYAQITETGILNCVGANIRGTVHATDGEFTGKITASGGSITGNLQIGGSLYSEKDNYRVVLRGVQSNTAHGIFYIEDLNGDSNGNRLFPFIVSGDGSFSATKASITGGTIGGFTIGNNSITSGTWGSDGGVMMCTGSDTPKKIGGKDTNGWCFTAGSKFGVTKDGDVYASNVDITGKINATSGNMDTVTATNLTVKSGNIKLGDATLNQDGLVVSGTGGKSKLGCVNIDSNSLFIGSWDYSSDVDSEHSTPDVFICKGSTYRYPLAGVTQSGWAIGAGKNFGVTIDGSMYCKKGEIGGLVIHTNGSLGKTYADEGGLKGIMIYPDGFRAKDGRLYYIVIYQGSQEPVGGISSDGWHSI